MAIFSRIWPYLATFQDWFLITWVGVVSIMGLSLLDHEEEKIAARTDELMDGKLIFMVGWCWEDSSSINPGRRDPHQINERTLEPA
jgi:hypothetical protein